VQAAVVALGLAWLHITLLGTAYDPGAGGFPADEGSPKK
jgi:hypothetical protein